MDHLINIEERDQVTFEDVQTLEYPLQAMLEPAPHCLGAKRQPLTQDTVQPLHAGPAVNADHIEVDPVAALQVGAGEQVAHQALDIDAIRAGHDDQSGGVLVIRLIPQVGYHGQFLCLHLLGDLLQDPRSGHLVGQGAHNDITALALPHRAHTQAAAAAGVHRHDVLAGRDNLRLGGEVRRQYMLAQFSHAGLRRLQQANRGAHHFPQVVGRHIGRHTHGNTGGAIEQHIGHLGGQHPGFVHGAVEVGRPLHGALGQLRQQHIGIDGQAGFGIAHRREGLGIIGRAPVTLAIDQRVAIAEILRHQHHRFIDRAVAMGVEFTDYIADGTRGLLELGAGFQAQLAHRVHDAALHGLEPVADMRQRAVENDVHGIVQVGLLRILHQRHLLDAVVINFENFRHYN